MDDSNIQIGIVYKRKEDKLPRSVNLSPEEYFDKLREGENLRENGIPKYGHTWKFLSIPIHELEWTLEQVSGTTEDRVVRTEFLRDGINWMIHRKDESGYEEIIHNTVITPIQHLYRAMGEVRA